MMPLRVVVSNVKGCCGKNEGFVIKRAFYDPDHSLSKIKVLLLRSSRDFLTFVTISKIKIKTELFDDQTNF